jgi:hypothetical protein
MSDGPLALTLVELGVPPVHRFAAAHARKVNLEGAATGRRPTEHIHLPGAQLESHRSIARVAQQQRLRSAEGHQRGPAAFVAHFRVHAHDGAAASIDAALTVTYRQGLHGHLTQSNRSASLSRPEM